MTDTLAPQALTALSEEEAMFRDAVAEFASFEIAPHVHARTRRPTSAPT